MSVKEDRGLWTLGMNILTSWTGTGLPCQGMLLYGG